MYTTDDESASPRLCGEFDCYGPGGYIVDNWYSSNYVSTITRLKTESWIDPQSAAVAALFNVVDYNSGNVGIVTILFEDIGTGCADLTWPLRGRHAAVRTAARGA